MPDYKLKPGSLLRPFSPSSAALILGLLGWMGSALLPYAHAQSSGTSTPPAPMLPSPDSVGAGRTPAKAAPGPVSPASATSGAGMVTIESDRQQADNTTGIVTATGNVRIVYPERGMIATARQAQYFSREARLVLSGDVEVVDGDGQRIKAERLIYLLNSEKLQAEPASGRQVMSKIRLQSAPGGPPAPPMP